MPRQLTEHQRELERERGRRYRERCKQRAVEDPEYAAEYEARLERRRAWNRKYQTDRTRTPEELAAQKVWGIENRDKINAARRRRRKENREAFNESRRAADRKYRESNREKRAARVREYRKRNPEVAREHARRSRAIRKGQTLTTIQASMARDWVEIIKNDPCAYSGELRVACEIDHIVPLANGGGHEWSNLTNASQRLNRSKGSKSLLEFLLYRLEAANA